LIFVIIGFISICCIAQKCQITSNGISFDLSPLASAQDYYLQKNPPNIPWDVYINLCKPLVNQICGSGVAMCQIWDPNSKGGHASLGTAVSLVLNITGKSGQTLLATFSGGDLDRGSTITFYCDPSIDKGMPTYLIERPQYIYNFEWRTKYACPINNDPCSKNDNCESCGKSGCYWCQDSSQCSKSKPNCDDLFSNPALCPSCNYKKCEDCTERGCLFCLDSNSCTKRSNTTSCDNYVSHDSYCPSQFK